MVDNIYVWHQENGAGSMLNGLDLFSGIGGLSLSLGEWVEPIAYCENDRHAQAILLSRIERGQLPDAPIWDDVRTLSGHELRGQVDIIYGGFPCQDISAAGRGVGMEQGERSGLFFQITRLVEELRPAFVFLENVPAIRTRGLSRVLSEFTALRYDCRWTVVSAAEVGAPHLRKRWFLMAHANGLRESSSTEKRNEPRHGSIDGSKTVADTESGRWIEGHSNARGRSCGDGQEGAEWGRPTDCCRRWAAEPNVGRVAHGVPLRMDRVRGLGNAVVPAQAREAFMRLGGID